MRITLRAPDRLPPPSARPPLVALVPAEIEALHDELREQHAAFAPLFRREEQRRWARKYLEGQMLPLERTSLEPMAEALVGGNGQARQQCSSSGVWDDDAVLAKQQELVAATLGDSGARSVSRFNRRLHRLAAWLGLAAETLGELLATVEAFLIDSMPIPACRRARARRCRKVSGKAYCGYCAAKKEKFFDWRLHLVCTTGGVPVAFDLLPGGRHDLTPLHELTDWGCPDATDI